MNTLVVIGTSENRHKWASECLASVKVSYPTIVVSTGGYELGKIKWVYDNTNVDRFAFLQDSTVIKDNELFATLLEDERSVCLFHDGESCMNGYNGIYNRESLDKITIPVIDDKEQSIVYERDFALMYQSVTEVHHVFEPFAFSTGEIIKKHGRENKLFGNILIDKWKANWGQIPRSQWNSQDLTYMDYLKKND